MGGERVVVVVACRDRVHLTHEIVGGHGVVGRVEESGVERHLVERQVAILKHVEHAIHHPLVVGAGQEEHSDAYAVGLAFHLARAVVVLDEIAHFLCLSLDIVAVAFASRDFLNRVFAEVVHNLVADDESQLSLILHLSDEASANENHALASGEGVDVGRLDGIEPQLVTQRGVVFQKSVGNVLHHTSYGVAEEYTSRGYGACQLVGGAQNLVAIAQFAIVIVAHALFVAGVEFVEAHAQVGGHGAFRMQTVEVVKVVVLLRCRWAGEKAAQDYGKSIKGKTFHRYFNMATYDLNCWERKSI